MACRGLCLNIDLMRTLGLNQDIFSIHSTFNLFLKLNLVKSGKFLLNFERKIYLDNLKHSLSTCRCVAVIWMHSGVTDTHHRLKVANFGVSNVRIHVCALDLDGQISMGMGKYYNVLQFKFITISMIKRHRQPQSRNIYFY